MTTKVVKIQVVKPLDDSWEVLGEVLHDIQYDSWRVSNKMVQGLWEYSHANFGYKEAVGEYLNLKEDKILPKGDGKVYFKNVLSDIKHKLKPEAYKLPGDGYDALGKMVKDVWDTRYQEMINGRESVVHFKRSIPIELNSRQMIKRSTDELMLKKQEREKHERFDRYEMSFNLISKEYAKQIGRKDGWFRVALAVKDDYQQAIVDRVISREYKLSFSKLTYDKRKKKWFFMMAYTFESKKVPVDKKKIMGIDLGVNVPAMLAINRDAYYEQAVGDSQEVWRFEKQMLERRKKLLQQRKWCGEGSVGHGQKTRLKPLEKLGNKIANFKDTKNHAWSRYIVNEAIKHGCGVIQMEDLTGISESNKFLKTWTYFDLQQKITYKAKEVGIDVKLVDPAYTSARCSRCGHIHMKENKHIWRPSQDTFKCMACHHGHDRPVNADANASKNIATKDIDKIIKKAREDKGKEKQAG